MRITILPDSIRNLTNLEQLILSENRLKSLPEGNLLLHGCLCHSHLLHNVVGVPGGPLLNQLTVFVITLHADAVNADRRAALTETSGYRPRCRNLGRTVIGLPAKLGQIHIGLI